jgi:hypothetical protein
LRETTRITRVRIPDEVKQEALVESGYRCAVPQCGTEWPALHFHHIQDKAGRHAKENLLVLCSAHFEMVNEGEIKEADCLKLKEVLRTFHDLEAPEVAPVRNRLLYSLAAELYMNMQTLEDPKFQQETLQADRPTVYPRLLRTVLDQAIAAGVFIHDHDEDLFGMLRTWAEIVGEFNRRLDITEFRSLSVLPATPSATAAIVDRRTVEVARKHCRGLAVYLLEEYGSEAGLDFTNLFAESDPPDTIQP